MNIAPLVTLSLLVRHRSALWSTTVSELRKRYSGTLFGSIWIVVYPLLFLSVYLFVYLVIFRTRFPGFSELDYVLYVFAGLVPYIAFMECLQNSALSVKQNLHLVKNVLLPIELIPTRAVLAATIANFVGLALVIILAAINGSLSTDLLYLPLALLVQTMWLLGVAFIMAPIGIMLPDVNHVTGIISLFLVFVSPVGFKPDMLPEALSFIVTYNPIYYLMSPFRMAFGLFGDGAVQQTLLISVLMAVVTFGFGTWFFRKFKNFLVDYE